MMVRRGHHSLWRQEWRWEGGGSGELAEGGVEPAGRSVKPTCVVGERTMGEEGAEETRRE